VKIEQIEVGRLYVTPRHGVGTCVSKERGVVTLQFELGVVRSFRAEVLIRWCEVGYQFANGKIVGSN
jgi:hypothetical protein